MAFDFLKRIFNPNNVTIALDDIQALILRSRPVPYFGTVAIFEIDDATQAKSILKELLPLITSAQDWHQNEDASVTLTFTYKGLEKIGLPKESLDSFPESFREGMKNRATFLYDVGVNDPKNWEKDFKYDNIHVAAAIIANNEEDWRNKLLEFKSKIEKNKALPRDTEAKA